MDIPNQLKLDVRALETQIRTKNGSAAQETANAASLQTKADAIHAELGLFKKIFGWFMGEDPKIKDYRALKTQISVHSAQATSLQNEAAGFEDQIKRTIDAHLTAQEDEYVELARFRKRIARVHDEIEASRKALQDKSFELGGVKEDAYGSAERERIADDVETIVEQWNDNIRSYQQFIDLTSPRDRDGKPIMLTFKAPKSDFFIKGVKDGGLKEPDAASTRRMIDDLVRKVGQTDRTIEDHRDLIDAAIGGHIQKIRNACAA